MTETRAKVVAQSYKQLSSGSGAVAVKHRPLSPVSFTAACAFRTFSV